jgi:hypothetical protein
MAGTPSSTRADPQFDGSFGVAEHLLADLEDALATLVRANFASDADLRAAGPAAAPPSRGKPGTLARVAIVVGLAAAAISAWRLTAPPPIQASALLSAPAAATAATASGAAPAERRQIERTARDIADLRQIVDRLAASQGQLTRLMRKLEGAAADAPSPARPDTRMPHRGSAPPAPRVVAHKPTALTPIPRPAPRRVATASRPSAASQRVPQMHAEARLAAPPPLRPPMPVPQP